MKGLIPIIFIVAVLIGLWVFADSLPFVSEINVYQGFCPNGARGSGLCPAGEEAANPVTYKADARSQSVVHWVRDSKVWKFETCAVRDVRNWTCTGQTVLGGGGIIDHIMINGEYTEVVTTASNYKQPEVFYQVPKWRWQILDWQTKKL